MKTQNPLRSQVLNTCRHLLSEINRDPATPTCGCFDRRYWAWKTIDFPEATFQRNLNALAWFLKQPEAKAMRAPLSQTIKAGLLYACKIQHGNGSFDQAYPFEQSYGATGFLLPDLLNAYQGIRADCSPEERANIEAMLMKSSSFLVKHAELHGLISNHLAGAALGLYQSADFFHQADFRKNADKIVEYILSHQSAEGWYVEYGGADPGYQTLCMYYLAQIYQLHKSKSLRASLEKSLDFLQYFIHPVGTFGGEYGSRRTEIYYPGGIALLSNEFPAAAQMTAFMLEAIENGCTANLNDVDMGNIAPLVGSYIKALEIHVKPSKAALPFTQNNLSKKYQQAGLFIKSTPSYYCILSSANGGVVKLFNKQSAKMILDDCGVIGEMTNGEKISTQFTDPRNPVKLADNSFECDSGFYRIQSTLPSPSKFVLLRIMNLTFMRFGFLNELAKKMLVGMLISTKNRVPLHLHRKVEFFASTIRITDNLEKTGNISIKNLSSGVKFSAIHMASARYFTPAQFQPVNKTDYDLRPLNQNGKLELIREIELKQA